LISVTWGLNRASGLCEQRHLVADFDRQLAAYKWREQSVQSYRRQNGVPGLFQSENGLHSKILIRQSRALPVRLLDTPGIDQIDFSNPHGCRCGNRSIKNLGARKREDQSQRERLQRFSLQAHIHLESIPIDMFDPTHAGSSTDDAYAQFITGSTAQNFANMQKPAARKTYAVFTDEVFAFKQYVVQIVTGW
jgi:hypothetical protein